MLTGTVYGRVESDGEEITYRRRGRGRPRVTVLDSVKRLTGLSLKGAIEAAAYRGAWNRLAGLVTRGRTTIRQQKKINIVVQSPF